MIENSRILRLLGDVTVYGDPIPVVQGFFHGHDPDYITFELAGTAEPFYVDDGMVAWRNFYDVDIYSKVHLNEIAVQVVDLLEADEFEWQPSRSSGDLYEEDTDYHHKTLCFAITHIKTAPVQEEPVIPK